jgi:exonuclease VII small subunit
MEQWRKCEVCGGPLNKQSKYGVCKRNPGCLKERNSRKDRAYRESHKDKCRDNLRRWISRNRDRWRKCKRTWEENHPGHKSFECRKYRFKQMLPEHIRQDERKLARAIKELERNIECRKQTRSQLAAAKRQLKLLRSFARAPRNAQVLQEMESELLRTSRDS